jgi:hypothetical protein
MVNQSPWADIDSKKCHSQVNYDLHIHTTASDGVLTPEQVVYRAYELNLTGLAVTDHDTVDGLAWAQDYIHDNQLPLDFIPGIEMNTELEGYEIHILGYFIDPKQEKLCCQLEQIKWARLERAERMVKKLRGMGMMIDMTRVQEIAIEELIARPHIARALIEKGYISCEREAFDRFIGKGRPAYVPRYKFEPQTAIELIRDAGGASVLAHPGLLHNDRIVEMVIEMGAQGLEVYYPEHSPGLISKYLELCRRKNLLVTGGSDYHGTAGISHCYELGTWGVNCELVNQLKRHINRKK